MSNNLIGLRTQDALNKLYKELEAVTLESSRISKRNWLKSWVRDSIHPLSPYTNLTLISICVCVVLVIALLACGEAFSGVFVFLLLLCGVGVTLWQNWLRHGEVIQRAREVCDLVWRSRDVRWTAENYPNNCLPASPCITLQLTYRDGEIVNLPWALLVKGDVVVIRPGQIAPGLCTPLEDKNGPILHAHEVYSPPVASQTDRCTHPTARAPLELKKYLMQETPYVKNLKLGLDQALGRPVAIHDRERYLLLVKFLQYSVLPTVFILTLIANTTRYLNIYKWVSRGNFTEMFLIQPMTVILPLIPLVYPISNWLLNAYDVSKLRAVLQDATPNQEQMDPFEEPDISESKDGDRQFGCLELWKFWVDALVGRSPLLTRTVNIVDVLGSVTALCCVDKKGILSWPNPTAEKVFILRTSGEHVRSVETLNSEGYNSQMGPDPSETGPDQLCRSFYDGAEAVVEVLDVTHDHTSPFRLHFDDPSWKQYLDSLKPLGLAILLNTCNVDTQETYNQFCSHITCEALLNESLVPVTNRRCLCELAAEIGFVDQAQQGFKFEHPLCTFKQLRPEIVKRDIKFARQLPTKLKFPFPHMMATVVKDKHTGCNQLFSQGTADIILDSCVEYWDGYDLHPLTPADRKKIIDFYQRTSLSSNCTAFAYRPLCKTLSQKLAHIYLELPCDNSYIYAPYRSPTPLAFSMMESKWRGILAGFHSSDSLLGCEAKEEMVDDIEGCFDSQSHQIFVGMVTMQYQAQADMVQLIEQLERACIRFVHFSKENELRSRVFSEKMGLESGWNCHISLLSDRNRSENGDDTKSIIELEEGNSNCGDVILNDLATTPLLITNTNLTPSSHALSSSIQKQVLELNERTNLTSSRAFSFSAPSAINMDVATVKIGDEETVTWPDDQQANRRASQISENEAEQSRSLSCLTDSTDQSVPFNFDISNRAKLPRGIDKIRPHLEMIDNVPLLVSLFTDCTPSVTWEMLKIMQDYGEVVVVLGSSANCDNMQIFMQADASIAVEPLYPQVCQKVPAFTASYNTLGERIIQPVDLSRNLNSFTCAISVRREDPISMLRLIMQARHSTYLMRNALQFALCSTLSVCAIALFSVIFMLPPLFTIDQVAFTCFLLIPIVSSSLVALPVDPQIMQTATGKNHFDFNWEVLSFVLWCYGLKFLPAVVAVLSFHIFTLSFYCHAIAKMNNSSCTFLYMNLEPDASTWGGWSEMSATLLYTQNLSSGLFILQIVVISIGFVHRDRSIWKRWPIDNFMWLLAAIIIPILQFFASCIILSISKKIDQLDYLDQSLPWFLPFFAIFSLLITFVTNEAVKWQEIKVNKRFQRRKRLDFGTKLGMNSPF